MIASFFTRPFVLDIALAIAFGYVLFNLLELINHLWIDVLVQHVGRTSDLGLDDGSVLELLSYFGSEQGPQFLAFTIGNTYVPYGLILPPLSALLLLAVVAMIVKRVQRRCPHCRSVVARDATTCSSCSLELGAKTA
jgi:hypothetical protein